MPVASVLYLRVSPRGCELQEGYDLLWQGLYDEVMRLVLDSVR